MNLPTVSIVIPAYNEEAFIARLLERVSQVPTESVGFAKEIIVVDDGSVDQTASVVAKFPAVRLIRQQNQGKGAAVQRGVKEATGEFVLVQDADLEYDPADYIPMLAALAGQVRTAVYGSRIRGVVRDHGWQWPCPGKKSGQRIGPWVMNVTLSILTFLLYGRWITDMLTGYKIYPREFLNAIKVKTAGFETDHELSAKLFKAGYRVREVPVSYLPRSVAEGKKITPLDGLKALYVLWRFRFGN